MKRPLLILSLSIYGSIVSGVPAQERAGDAPVPEQVRAMFRTLDLNGDGSLTQSEINTGFDDIFLSMDANGDGVVSRREFVAWGIGESAVAAERQASTELRDVKGHFFDDNIDRNRDGSATRLEIRNAFLDDFLHADQNNDMQLDLQEFYHHSPLFRQIGRALR